jgi:hypothetical protein
MPPITSDHGVLDWSLPIYVSLLAFVGLLILTGGFIWLQSRRAKTRQMDAATKDSLEHLREQIWQLYQDTKRTSNPDYFGVWRAEYIKAVEAKFGPHIWQKCAKAQSLPPVELVFEPAQ